MLRLCLVGLISLFGDLGRVFGLLSLRGLVEIGRVMIR